MNTFEKVEKMSDEQLKSIWASLGTQSWCGADMYDEHITMDEWGIMIACEMDSRRLNKFEKNVTSTNWEQVPKGTKVRYKNSFNKFENGYFAGIFKPTECIIVSKIDKDIEFTNTKMDDYGICTYVKLKNVELFETH